MSRYLPFILSIVFLKPLFAQPIRPGANPPLTLEAAVKEATEHNLTLLAERYNLSLADARLVTASLRPNPVLTVTGSSLDVPAQQQLNPREFTVHTDYTLERGGKRERRMELARAAKSSTQLQFLNSLRGVVFDVQSAFVDVLLAKDTVELAQGNLRALSDIADLNAIRARAGDIAGVELARSRIAALQSRNALQQAELRLASAKNRLQLLLGRAVPSPDFDVAGAYRPPAEVIGLDETLRQALATRPDLLALRQEQNRIEADLRLQLAQAKVDYGIGSEYSRQQQRGMGSTNVVGFSFTVPLPVFNRNQGEIQRAQIELRQNEIRIRALEAAIRNEVENAFRAYLTSKTLLDAYQRDMIEQASQVRQIMEHSYRHGEASLIEFLDAQRAFNEVMQGYSEARAEYTRNLFLIESVTGKSVNP